MFIGFLSVKKKPLNKKVSSEGKMIVTPLGKINVMIDGNSILYHERKCVCDKTCKDLDGRYMIVVDFIPDGKIHEIKCSISNYKSSRRDGIESGERLELKSFYNGKIKLSIGMEGESGYFSDGTRLSEYDYDNEYDDDGVKYIILPETKTSMYTFGVAWINETNENNDVQTWFGADPTLIQ